MHFQRLRKAYSLLSPFVLACAGSRRLAPPPQPAVDPKLELMQLVKEERCAYPPAASHALTSMHAAQFNLRMAFQSAHCSLHTECHGSGDVMTDLQ